MGHEQDRYVRLREALQRLAAVDHNLRHVHSDTLVLLMLLWSALHDRPVCWACDRRHWPAGLRPRCLPSQSCMSRRLRTIAVSQLLERFASFVREQLPCGLVKYIDAKPLPVGNASKDPDARFGRSVRGMGKGYKLFALVDAVSKAVDDWVIGPMNGSEQKAAEQLMARACGPCVFVGDGVYDARFLYEAAAAMGNELVANAARTANGLGHGRQSVARSQGLAVARTDAGAALINSRNRIERTFGHWTCFGGGLGPLPAWIRTPHRVAFWIAAKHLINLDRLICLHQQSCDAA